MTRKILPKTNSNLFNSNGEICLYVKLRSPSRSLQNLAIHNVEIFKIFQIVACLDPGSTFYVLNSSVCVVQEQGVTKRCRLSWLTISALLYEPQCGGRGGVAGSQPMSPKKLWKSNSIFNLWIIPQDSSTPAFKRSIREFQSIFENSAINSNIQSFNSRELYCSLSEAVVN